MYPIGSVYIDGNNAATCPMAAVISGSSWTKIGSKLLTNASDASIVGNGKPIGLIVNNNGVLKTVTQDVNNQNYSLGVSSGNYPNSGDSYNTSGIVKFSETNSNASGLVAKLSTATTSLTVTLWMRTK